MTTKTEIPVNVLLQYFRVPTGDLPVDYPGRPVLLGSSITNISTTGVYVRTTRPLPKGATLDIAFSLPSSTVKITAKAVVRWSSQGEAAAVDPASGGVAGMGLEFTDISAKHRKLVVSFVESFLHRMRRDT